MKYGTYVVMWKRHGEWVEAYHTDYYEHALQYAANSIFKGGSTERIEVRNQTAQGLKGDTYHVEYDSNW